MNSKNNERPNILYVSLWPWDALWQRPQHLAQQLAANYNVIFTSAIPFHSGKGKGKFKNKIWNLEKQEITEQLSVLNFYFLPSWRFDSIRRWNHRQWVSSICDYIKQENISIDILWVSSPEHLPFLKRINSRLACYDCMDNYESFFPQLASIEQELFRRVDVSFVSAALLEDKARKFAKEVHLVPNGVEVERFSKVLEEAYPLPADMSTIPSPRIGYYGSIDDWMDCDIFDELFKKTGLSTVLIGPIKSNTAKKLKESKHVILLGAKPYSQLPAYLAHFSVCILPFKDTELTRAVDPVKVYEYLAAGKDVVATPLPALAQHGKLLSLALPADFSEAIGAFLEYPTPREVQTKRSAAMSEHSWAKRAEMIRLVFNNKGI